MKHTHDIPLGELDGQHAKSTDCPCGTDVEVVVPGHSAIVYHQRVGGDGIPDDEIAGEDYRL